MKILLVEWMTSGHHLSYAEALDTITEQQMILAIPKSAELFKYQGEWIEYDNPYPIGTFRWYKRLLKEVSELVTKYHIEIVHFLYGDCLFRFFGIGLGNMGVNNILITFHQFRYSRLRDISRKIVFHKIRCGVVHTKVLCDRLRKEKIKNVEWIEYPHFNQINSTDQKSACDSLGIKADSPILLALGGTREDKGLDLLLKALKEVKSPFYLLVAGKEETFQRDYIEKECCSYYDRVHLLLKFLSQEEFALCLSACDVLVLPYRRIFDGASGPLGEGVRMGKTIIGPEHGSLGEIIRTNHLGYTFEAENINSLAKNIEKALTSEFRYDKVALSYEESLKPEKFADKYNQLYRKIEQGQL